MFGPGPSLPSATQYNFAQVPSANIQRSSFNRTHNFKTTLDAGYLVPFFLSMKFYPAILIMCELRCLVVWLRPSRPSWIICISTRFFLRAVAASLGQFSEVYGRTD